MTAAAVADGPTIAADLGRIVGASNVEIRPAALVPYRTDATFGFAGTPWAAVSTLPGARVVSDQGRCGALHARIGLQDSCHLRNGLGVRDAPRAVLDMLGDYVEIPGAGDCRGAAGTYAILRRRDSQRVLAAKLAAPADLDLDFLVMVNPGGQRQLTTAVRRAGLRTKVVHLAEIVASAQDDHR
ncbi:hypothetical protein GCM10010399_02510 [Dactylosporangium fulvum]|uniref:(Fe-S)-binding protein n=1 Tax=Dactylosporangium fulvum TaxID=53359 RepID=A0ABY5VRU2_9ACTN|nr:(Fe-S)-binding protein [Dactylosporangium fulvum]UWP79806.1 (Fe-S)-binding protein [Dactylosporangium fulvum]